MLLFVNRMMRKRDSSAACCKTATNACNFKSGEFDASEFQTHFSSHALLYPPILHAIKM